MSTLTIRWILVSIIIAAGIVLGPSARGGSPNFPPQNSPTPPPAVARALVGDMNYDGYPDFLLQNASTHQTAIWYLENNLYIGGVYGPTLPAGWGLKGVGDFDYGFFGPPFPDYVL